MNLFSILLTRLTVALALAGTGALALVPVAHAISVTNLDTVEHRVIMATTELDGREYVVKPGQTIRTNSAAKRIKLAGESSFRHGEFEDEYVIWKGGKLAIQFRQKQRSTGN